MQHVWMWLQREWFLLAIVAFNVLNGLRASRGARRAFREKVAIGWPAVEGIARSGLIPAGPTVTLRAEPVDGSAAAHWWHRFGSADEARHYRTALNGVAVPVHVNPDDPKERIVCWKELRGLVPKFVWPDGGRMTAYEFGRVRWFQGITLLLGLIGLADVAWFATPQGRSVEWQGLCLCELSLGLALASLIMMLFGVRLRTRMNDAGLDEAPDRVRRTTRAVAATALAGWIGLVFAGATYKGEMPDPVFFGLVMLPVAALLWFCVAVGIRAEHVLKPFEALVVPRAEKSVEKTERMERGELVGAASLR